MRFILEPGAETSQTLWVPTPGGCGADRRGGQAEAEVLSGGRQVCPASGKPGGEASRRAESSRAAARRMPYFSLLTAWGLLVFARIVRAGADVRADLEGTV
ncbi:MULTISPECIES: hypothetical protein [Streptomyces]|uniref:Uncharacterized protein n=1 Tax=Streptomyces clavifer TaxID=68188 RepID=A0ABS4VIX5_9ACTN|nr:MULTISPECIES: hypothetical protein [Streptomyces]MBP2363874.1 hypothetical protein [Streptomyces clavifer]MDX2744682.1 hypothetical protein [Streptomyces sp. NRRL_B-2557]GHB08980.1 hypothetical protein GCM10010392_40250 [Streptomyces clavifer]